MSNKKTLNIYEVLEALNDKINNNTTSNNLLLEKLDNLSKKTDKSVNSLNSKIKKQNTSLDIYKTSISNNFLESDKRVDKLNEYITTLKISTDKKLSELKEYFIDKINTLNRTHSKELENTIKIFETNLETQSNKTKTYLLVSHSK